MHANVRLSIGDEHQNSPRNHASLVPNFTHTLKHRNNDPVSAGIPTPFARFPFAISAKTASMLPQA